MKKLLMSLATISLMTGSLSNMTAFIQKTISHQTLKSYQTTNEDAEDIANKLWNKTIKIDPSFWLNKNIQTDQTDFNKVLVKQEILTQDEAQYVKWGSLNISKAGYFWNKGAFSVKKDGATATGSVTIDADSGSTTQQIAAKISKATNIKFNYNYWNNKAVQNNLPAFRNILVNDKILTRAEASVVTGLVSPLTIKQVGSIAFKVDVNDNNTNTDANAHVNVVNDGKSAQQIAHKFTGYYYGLKTNTVGMYADNSYVIKNFRNVLLNNFNINATDANTIELPHVKLKGDNPNITATVNKDGQIATANVQLECKDQPFVYYYQESQYNITFYLNFTPAMRQILKSYFSVYSSQVNLGYFYNMLDDGNDGEYLPSYSGTSFVPQQDALENNMDPVFCDGLQPKVVLGALAQTNYSIHSGNANFAKALYNEVLNGNGYLSIMINWHYSGETTSIPYYDITNYHFW